MKTSFQFLVRLAVIAACQLSLLGQVPDFNHLVSLWRLSANTADGYGANNATFVGEPAYEPGPRPSTQAAVLAGGSYLNAGKGIAFDATDPFSVTAWIKGPIAQDSTIIGRMRQGGGFTGWELHVGTDAGGSQAGQLNVWLIDSFGPNYNQINSPAIVLDDTWHHVAFTYDGSYFAQGVRIYVDGMDATGDATADLLDFGSTILAEDVDLNLGSRQNGANHTFTGSLHEVSVWNTVLAPEHIAYIHANGVHPPVLIESFLAEPPTVFAGTPTTLSWTTDPGATLTLEPGIGDVTAITVDGQGSAQVSPEAETVYTLTATQGARTTVRSVTIGIRPLITSFSATQLEVPVGSPTVLSWRVHPEADVTLQPGIGDVTALTSQGYGRIVATPNIDTTYILQVNRMGLTGEAQLDIRVVEPPASAPPNLDHLISYWPLNTTLDDALGANPGEFLPQASYGPGLDLETQAALFNGSSYITVGQDIALDSADAFSVTAWIAGPLEQDSAIIGRMQQGGTYTGWELHVGTGAGGSGAGRLNVWLINAFGSDFLQVNSPAIVLDNSWHHVAFTYDGSYLGSGVRIYVDGVDATGETSADTLFSSFLAENVDLNLGSRQNGAFHNFIGSLAQVSIWQGVLSSENIAHIYLFGVGIEPPAPITLSGADFVPPGTFLFTWNSVAGQTYRIESSADLVQWTLVADNYPAGGATGPTTVYSDAAATDVTRFYRVRPQP
jgi:hypothetical protein